MRLLGREGRADAITEKRELGVQNDSQGRRQHGGRGGTIQKLEGGNRGSRKQRMRMLRGRKSAEWYSEETEEGGKGLAFSEQVIIGQEP